MNGFVELNGRSITMQGDYEPVDGVTTIGSGGTLRVNAIFTQRGSSSRTSLGGGSVNANSFTILAGTVDLDSGTINAPVVVAGNGKLGGIGTIVGDLTNLATVAIANGGPTGTLSIWGNYTQGATGTLAISLGGYTPGAYDQLWTSGAANLDGTLSVTLVSGYAPQAGNLFETVNCEAGARNGTFASVIPLGSASAFSWTQETGDDYVALRVGNL
jgi:hypothetical protein